MSIADSKKNFPKPFDQVPSKGYPELKSIARKFGKKMSAKKNTFVIDVKIDIDVKY